MREWWWRRATSAQGRLLRDFICGIICVGGIEFNLIFSNYYLHRRQRSFAKMTVTKSGLLAWIIKSNQALIVLAIVCDLEFIFKFKWSFFLLFSSAFRTADSWDSIMRRSGAGLRHCRSCLELYSWKDISMNVIYSNLGIRDWTKKKSVPLGIERIQRARRRRTPRTHMGNFFIF